MLDHATILAAPETESTLKIVLGVVFAGIWVLAQVLSAWNERKKKQPKVPRPPRAPRSQPPTPPRRVEMPPRRMETPPQRQRVEPPPRVNTPRSTPRRQQPPRTAPPVRRPEISVESPITVEPALSTVSRTAGAASAAAADAAGSAPTPRHRLQAILRPRNLRKEFILTEILQPPISMRPSPFDSQR